MRIILFVLALSLTLYHCDKNSPEQPELICGCTNELAVNYDSAANCDDGSCVEIGNDQNQMALLFTSTGCNGCGLWGIDCFDGYVEKLAEDVVPVTAHFKYYDPMITEMNKEWRAYFNPRFSPYFITGTKTTIDLSDGCTSSERAAKTKVDEHLKKEPVFNMGATLVFEENGLRLITAYEQLRHEPGVVSYKLAAFVLEDHIIEDQSIGWKEWIYDFEHNNTLRAGFTDFNGQSVDVKTGETGTRTFFLDYDSIWNLENIYAVVIIWAEQKDGSFELVNIIQSNKD